MKTTRDYSKSPCKAFDAVEDIKSYLGKEKWEKVSPAMAHVARLNDPEQFYFYASLAGIEGYPVEAWYDLYQGQGSYRKALGDVPIHS